MNQEPVIVSNTADPSLRQDDLAIVQKTMDPSSKQEDPEITKILEQMSQHLADLSSFTGTLTNETMKVTTSEFVGRTVNRINTHEKADAQRMIEKCRMMGKQMVALSIVVGYIGSAFMAVGEELDESQPTSSDPSPISANTHN